MRIEDAIAHTAGAPCLMVLSFPKECVTPLECDRSSPMEADPTKGASSVATWLVRGWHLVTLTRGEHDTFIYFHSKDLLF